MNQFSICRIEPRVRQSPASGRSSCSSDNRTAAAPTCNGRTETYPSHRQSPKLQLII